MRSNMFKAALIKSGLAASVLLLANGAAFGQQTVNLTAGPATAAMPDGTGVPMWGYTCGAVASTSTSLGTCTALNPAVQLLNTTPPVGYTVGSAWSPVVITVPVNTAGPTSLTINLTNTLSFTPTGATTANTVPTSLTIVGQLGGGLGTPSTVPSPAHPGQSLITWATQTPANFTPPPQGARVQSFGTEVAATGATPTATQVASGSALTWSNLQPGTYLIESGTHPSIQGPMGLYGVLVVTSAPAAAGSTGCAYPGATAGSCLMPSAVYSAEVPLLMGEIDPVQNNSVNTAVNTAGFSETKVWSGQPGACGNAASPVGVVNTCYPPAVNYLPVYYTINGVGFSRTNPSGSLFPATLGTAAAPVTGNVLVRLVNAGLRMHVPSIVGSQTTGFTGAGAPGMVSGFTLVAEDGNPVPGTPHVQTEVFMAAGKTYDVAVNVPAAGASLPVYDRELSLSGNQIDRDAGMLAYISVNGSLLPNTGAFSTTATTVAANPDTYNSVVAGQTFTVSDPSKGVIGNDINVYGVKVSGTPCTSPGVPAGCVGATTVGGAAATTQVLTNGTVTLMANGTFTYVPNAGSTATSDSFGYCANGTTTICTTVTLSAAALEAASGITCSNSSYTAPTASYLAVKPPGVLAGCKDAAGYPLTAVMGAATGLVPDGNGGFTLSTTPCTTAGGCPVTFPFQAKNSQGTLSAAATATVTFPAGSGLAVTVIDPTTKALITDYRWILEEDRTFYNDPKCTTNPPPATCPTATITGQTVTGTTVAPVTGIVPGLGLNLHTSYMPYVAQGCTGAKSCEYGQTVVDKNPTSATYGQHVKAVCDVGNGVCRPDPGNGTSSGGSTWVDPAQLVLDPTKRYYLSVFPGDAADPFYGANSVGHGLGGTPIPAAACGPNATGTLICTWPATGATCQPGAGQTVCVPSNTTSPGAYGVTALVQESPYPTGDLSVFVFEDDFPLNGEQDGGGGVGQVNTNNEPGLGGFQIHLWDAMGQTNDFTGQMGFDMFNQPLSNSLAGTRDPLNGNDACPIAKNPLSDGNGNTDPTATGITGFIVTCPQYESDNMTPSPLAGQAVIKNLMPMRVGVIATPGADRIARGEEWLQTNTLDGQKAHDAFFKMGEPGYFQEFGPAGFHVSIGFANPAIINARRPAVCAGTDPTGLNAGANGCKNTLKGRIVGERLSRTPDERLYGSGSHDAFAWTQCFVSFGDPDGEDFAFTKCDADGNWTLTGLPDGDWRITTFDQWNDELVDGLSTPVRLGSATNASCNNGVGSSPTTCNVGDIATTQWQANLYTKTFIDDNRDGLAQPGETGIPFANVAVRLRDGSLANWLTTDFSGVASYNETFPLFNWYTVETDVTRYKSTGTHVVYDVGGPADGTLTTCGGTLPGAGYPPCGTSTIGKFLANTAETISLPTNLRVPGALYCAGADCTGKSISGLTGSTTSDPASVCTTATTPPYGTTCSTTLSSGRIDPPWVGVEGWQGFPGQFSFIEFGKAPYFEGENGGIHGHVVYASTRPFDDPQLLVQTQWTPLIPHVTINLYQEGVAADKVTPTLTLVDTTQTSSFDEWAHGFRSDGMPNMSCPGQAGSTGVTPDLFFFSLYNQPNYLDFYNSQHGGAPVTALANNSQFKCYDGMHNWNQVEPAPYDGMYQFPSVNSRNPASGAPQPISATISAISEAGSTVTVATRTTHGLVSGALVTIAGAPTGYNSADFTPAKLFAISVTGPKNFTYSDPNTGLAAAAAGSVTALGTNCTICVPDPVPAAGADADPLRHGLPMLPIGKYVVEVVLPQGYELVKEEDKNILIGDNYIAPVTQQFGGLGNVFILPDQASVATAYTPPGTGYNQFSANQPTQSFGAGQQNQIVPSFVPEPVWPCVGEARVVPDYISLFPQSLQVAPFAGATRNLCDRKEVTLSDQMGASAKFWLYTSTHVASKVVGVITDDYTSEFDPFSPQFGEKFSPPDMPVALKDFTGAEINRVYADHWGAYNGMIYSTWEVNPPNPTGYAPNMVTLCMNDPGPIVDTRQTILDPATGLATANPTLGQKITDPLFAEGYSQFCYEWPFMPGTTDYLDTPVVPTSAFVGAGYNNPDCAYPDATPAVREVDSQDGIGPWVSSAGHTLTIYALGDRMVPNNAYSGPSATTAPYNQKTIRRHYGFGNATGVNSTAGSVTIGGVAATVNSWSDTTIVATVPSGVPACALQQQAIYGGSAAQCGELVINTAATQAGGQVTGVSVVPPPAGNRGGTYTGNPPVAPTVSFTGGGGTGATATANLGPSTGSVASVQLSSGGSGYTANFTVTFSGGGGTGAHGTAVVRKRVTAVTITNAGSYACSAAAPTVSFSGAGGAGTTATGTVQLSACPTPAGTARRTVTGVTITNPTTNNYAIGATINVTFSPAGTGGTRALGNTTATGDTTGFVSSVTMTGGANSGGSGYSTAPAPVFTAGSGTGATGTSTLSASRTAHVVSVNVTNGGTGYTSAPTVTFSGPGSTRAIGTASVNALQTFAGRRSIDAVTVTIGGKPPVHVAASEKIQSYIDKADPGDLIIVDPTCTPTAAAGAPTGAPVACSNSPTQTTTEAAHNELLIMWKPVRLQGVGAASSVIDATTYPAGESTDHAGKLRVQAWREQIVCLFGLGLNGSPIVTTPSTTNPVLNPFDPTGQLSCPGTGWTHFTPDAYHVQVDRLPLEATVGWDANLNGNLAEQLQEPSLMGSLEGAGITVLAKGVDFHGGNPFDPTLLAGFPTGTTLLQNTLSNPGGAECQTPGTLVNPYPSNYSCNPSSIDGLTITQSSQGGGGIFVHGWGHNLQIANNRIYSNAGTLSGGINVGQGEYPPSYIQGSATNAAPGSCEESPVAGAILPYCHDVNVNVQNNYIALNSSTGDELFSASPAGAGAVSFCTGSDYYLFNYNWVCGNLSSGDGGGLGHLGFSYNGDIEHNSILFNQSTNPTIPVNGGGMIIMGTPDADVVCANNANIDQDCSPVGQSIVSVALTGGGTGYAATDTVNFAGGGGLGATGTITVGAGGTITGITLTSGGAGYTAPVAVTFTTSAGSGASATATLGGPINVQTAIGPSDGVGPGLVINANLIMGNAAESGTGGGIAFQAVNGADMVAFPNDPGQWNSVTVTNNIIVDNLAGWDGAGISLKDSANVNIINNTIAQNASTASSGVLFNTLGGPLASQQGPTCTTNCGTTSAPQVAGVVALQHSAILTANLAATPVVCPAGHFQGTGTNAATNGACRSISYPKLENNIIYHNSSYYIGVGGFTPQFQQNVVSLYNAFTGTAAPTQATTGACVAASFWDVGVRGDTGPTNHGSGVTLTASDSVLSAGGSSVLGSGNSTGNPNFVSFYCDGSRTPPEFQASGFAVPPGISDATQPSPVFNLTPVATVDEGNNWVNLRWGPLSMSNPTAVGGTHANYGGGLALGNYSIKAGSAAGGRVTGANFTDAPAYDFFDNPRKPGGSTDAGAVKLAGTPNHSTFTIAPAVVDFGYVPHGAPTTVDQDIVVTNSDVVPLTGINVSFNCAGVTGCNLASYSLAADVSPANTNPCVIGGSLGAGESCVLNVVFNPTSGSQAARNANLVVTAGGLNQTVSLTGHDSIATIAISPATQTTPAMNPATASTVAITGTITVTNTSTRCDAATYSAAVCPSTGIPAGYPTPSVDAGPFVPTAITLAPLTGTGTWALAGTCAVGTAINPGLAAIPANPADGTPASPYVPSGNCTVTVTYTPPAGATGAALNGTARVTVQGYGTAGATQPATIINRVINAN
jgi:hypothetical protein